MSDPDTAPGAPSDPNANTPSPIQAAVATATERVEALPTGSKRKALASRRKAALKSDATPAAPKPRAKARKAKGTKKAAKKPAKKVAKKGRPSKKKARASNARGKKTTTLKSKASQKRR